MNRRSFLKAGTGALAAAAMPRPVEGAVRWGLLAFDLPVSLCICSEGKWRNVKDELSVENGAVRMKAPRASWVRLTWAAELPGDSLVLCDAWERAYGDLGWRPVGAGLWSPWYFAVRSGGETRCVGVKTGPAALCSWSISCNSVSLLMDVRCGCQDTLFDGREVRLCELVQTSGSGSAWDVLHGFCSRMCSKPKFPSAPFTAETIGMRITAIRISTRFSNMQGCWPSVRRVLPTGRFTLSTPVGSWRTTGFPAKSISEGRSVSPTASSGI